MLIRSLYTVYILNNCIDPIPKNGSCYHGCAIDRAKLVRSHRVVNQECHYSVQDGIGESRDDEKDNDQQPQSNFAVCVCVCTCMYVCCII